MREITPHESSPRRGMPFYRLIAIIMIVAYLCTMIFPKIAGDKVIGDPDPEQSSASKIPIMTDGQVDAYLKANALAMRKKRTSSARK